MQAVFCRFIRKSLGPCSVIRWETSLSTCSPSGSSWDHLQQVGRQHFPNSGCIPHTLPVPVPTGVSSESPNSLQSSNAETDGKCLPHRLLFQTHRWRTGGLAFTQKHASKHWQQSLQPCRKTLFVRIKWWLYVLYNITWSIIGIYQSVINPELLDLKKIQMEPDQSELDSLTGYKNTHFVFSLLCTHTRLDAFISLTIFLHPAQA